MNIGQLEKLAHWVTEYEIEEKLRKRPKVKMTKELPNLPRGHA